MASCLDNSTRKSLFNIDFSYLGKSKFAHKKQNNQVNVKIYSFRLNHLFKSSNKSIKQLIKKELKLNRMRDLIHSLSALYDNCLPDIGASSIYDCICAPKSYTILIIKDDNKDDDDNKNDLNESDYDSNDCLSTVDEESNQEPSSIFTGIYSDMENEDDSSESDSSEEDENDEDHTIGVDTFLKQNSKTKTNSPNRIPIIKNLIGCATIQRTSTFQLPGQDEWIIDLQLMCIRKMYRGFNIGKYLLNSLIKNPNYVGIYDAIVTSSDVYATKFYEKYGFNFDHILNSKYANIGDIWTNTTKMCYLPTYNLTIDTDYTKIYVQPFEFYIENKNQSDLLNEREKSDLNDIKSDFICELTSMEKDYKKWQKLMFSSYQFQSQLFTKLKQEILMLKAKLCAKDGIIDDLRLENQLLVKKNTFLKLQLDKFLNEDNETSDNKSDNDNNSDDVYKLIAQLEAINDEQKLMNKNS